ncbi:LamG-like jellyroll fold domain-containing protein [Streptomyces sp. NPDC090045]|uniref:LamG-like jellyroll fold domain-containing protein n=1 Tax=Streptomyces sp. NPDC090045 TaxID=3365927 RepID=UPI0037F75070
MRRSRTLGAGLAATLLAGMATAVVAPPAGASGTEITTSGQILFRSGAAGYGCFRIPTIVKTKKGSLLAFAEARTSPSCADRGDIDIVVRRSTNDGATWGPVRVVTSGDGTDPDAPHTRGNPSPVVDILDTGRISLLSTGEAAIPTPGETRTAYAQESLDDGLTFSAPKKVDRFENGSPSGWFGTGPAHGIQLTAENGAHKGRLVVGAYEDSPQGRLAGYLYSDTGGADWHPHATTGTPGGTDKPKPGEATVAELADGSVYVGARNETLPKVVRPDKSEYDQPQPRTYAITRGTSTTTPAQSTTDLTTPSVQASVLTLEKTYEAKSRDLMVLTAPTGRPPGTEGPDDRGNPNDRYNLKIHYSTDEGKSWKAGATLKTGRAGYSDLVELDNGRLALVHEGGLPGTPGKADGEWSSANICFRSLDPTTLGLPHHPELKAKPAFTPRPAGRTSPDGTPQANDAYLAGNATLERGTWGKRLRLAEDGDHAEVPYSRSIVPGDDGKLTLSLEFSHTATKTTDPDRTILWAYGMGPGRPQIWIRANPEKNRIWARVFGTDGMTDIEVPQPPENKDGVAFGDGKPHRLALVRDGGTITLRVDDAKTDRTGQVLGRLADGQPDAFNGIRLGARPGSYLETLKGTIDEFRVHRAALDDTQLDALFTHNDPGPGAPAADAWLPFQVADTAEAPGMTPVAIMDDVSGHGADASVLGATHESFPGSDVGRIDKSSLKVSGKHPGLQVPYVPTLDVGADDFTYTLWFRHSTKLTTPQRLLGAYGNADNTPSLWARVERVGSDYQVKAYAETDPDTVVILTQPLTATADGWQLLTLRRHAGQFSLGVNSTFRSAAITGSFTRQGTAPFGLRVGSKQGVTTALDVLDGGAVDDVRLYHRALSNGPGGEIANIAKPKGENSYPKDRPALRWSMEIGNTQIHNVMRPAPQAGAQSTPDHSVHHNNAAVAGGSPVAGKHGSALRLDGSTGSVSLPYTSSKALGQGDFTLATWLKYDPTATTGNQVIAWAYGDGTTERSLLLRAEPGEQKIVAVMQTDLATSVTQVADTPFRTHPGEWHHLVLMRTGNTLTLTLTPYDTEKSPVLSAGTPARGSLTHSDNFGVLGLHLGSRPPGPGTDQYGPARLSGSLDDFRLYRRHLTTGELNGLRANTLPATDPSPAVHLAFDTLAAGNYARM